MRGALALALVAAGLAAAPAAIGAPPRAGVVVPGKSLGGVRLGATRPQVRAAWGGSFGVCRGCREPTWYFNFHIFEPQGAGVSFRGSRASALFTLWQPSGWRTDRGLRIGDPGARVASLYGPLLRLNCGTYSALTLRRARALTAIYLVDEKVWGFGVSRPDEPVCR